VQLLKDSTVNFYGAIYIYLGEGLSVDLRKKSSNLLWVGETPRPIKRDRSSDLVMDSVINYYKSEEPKLTYKVGKLFLDNGAFTANRAGIELNREKVIFVQETLKPDQTIPLDFPFRAGVSISKMMKLWEKTKENIIYWQNSTNMNGRLVPALHAWDKKSLIRNVQWIQRNVDSEYIALGSIVNPHFSDYEGFFGDRQPRKELVDMICFALSCVEKNSDFRVHLMGFGSSPLMLHLGYYLGTKSTDSSGYRRKAAHGKIILPGTGERHLGETSADFGGRTLNEATPNYMRDISRLEKCTCPICMINKYQLWSDWRARAIHNEHVLKQEVKVAEGLLAVGIETYEKYLDNVVFSHSAMKYLWEYAKLRRKYYRISEILFEGWND
jgi:queuine/archaeosine tRNA-ribosyltransferase